MAKKQLRPRRRRRPAANDRAAADLPLWPETVQRGALIAMLRKHVDGLRTEDPHGNRALFLDDVFIAYLLAFFNPSI